MASLSPINVDALESGFRAFLPNVTIFSKDLGRTNINLFDAQDYFLDELFAGLRQDIHWFVTAKGRQLGLTTICLLLDCFWCGTVPDVQGAVVFDTQQNKDKFRILLQDMLKNLPPAFRLPTSKFDRDFITFKNGNMLDFLTAGIKKGQGTLGRSRALNFVHGCMAPGTPIIVEHGRIKLIEDIKIGDQVLTHTGNLTKVIDVLGQPNQKGPLIRITPWLGDSLEFTREHNIPTQRGIITADEVNHWDWLVMPRRKIIDINATVLLPLPKTSHSIGAGETFSLNDRMGFVVGYYLAEGTILHQRNSGRASGVQFTRHRQEKTYADEAIRILQGCNLVGKRTTIDFPNSLSSADIVYGSAFSQWLCDVFGETNNKHIPDSVFSYGEAFCTGLVRGLLCGDGSKGLTHLQGYIINEMILPTTRASIAMQARDLVAALGWGWGSIHYKHGAVRRGRIEKPQWRVKWNGQAAKSLRHLLDLPASPMGQPHTEKYKLEDDRILIAIRLIERDIECEEIWDISVEHEDHTFRTPYMSVGNTEICSFGDPDAFEAFKDTLSDQFPARLYLFESTARGPNLFMDLWEEAGEDPITRKQIFIGWWRKETNRYRTNTRLFTRYGYPEKSKWELDSETEVKRVYGVEITLEQWAWFRHRLDPRASSEWSADDNSTRLEVVHEEHPTCVVAETLVGTNYGLLPISEAWRADCATFGEIGHSGQTGEAEVFRLTTKMGYSFIGTFNHPVKLVDGHFVNLVDTKDAIVLLQPPRTSERSSFINWLEGPVHCNLLVTQEFAEFVGLFMGDGSLSNHCLSIICTREDTLVVDRCLFLIDFLFGLKAATRTIGRRQGGTEVRVSSREFTRLFKKIGLIKQQGNNGRLVRMVHVPDFIKQAPQEVITSFLSGLFEADGWIGYEHTRITLSSKYSEFLADVQLLLLTFGITSTLRNTLYKQKHVGYLLDLKANESLSFVRKIGFISERKRGRSAKWSNSKLANAKRKPLVLEDKVVSIDPLGQRPIFNMNIKNGQNIFEANGIVTHNTPSDLFRQTGSSFIPGRMLKTAAEEAAKHPFKGYKYYIGEDLSAVRLEQLPAAFRNQIQLRIWQEPVPGGRYVLAADPAYASGDESDFFVISVFRVYADRCAQVAEFAERNMFEYQFAWVMAHLSNYYGLCRIILDVNGPGQAVLGEFRHLRQMLEGGALDVRKASDQITEQDLEQNRHFRSFFSGVRNYLYHRFDSFGGGYNLQWKSTVELQASMWAQFRDQLLTGHLQIYSQECLAQIRRLVQEGMYITAEGRGKKDRAVAAAMANRCWIDMERRSLIEEGRTFDVENSNPQLTQVNTVGQYISMAFRDNVASKEAQRQAANRMTSRPAWRAGVWRGRGRQ